MLPVVDSMLPILPKGTKGGTQVTHARRTSPLPNAREATAARSAYRPAESSMFHSQRRDQFRTSDPLVPRQERRAEDARRRDNDSIRRIAMKRVRQGRDFGCDRR